MVNKQVIQINFYDFNNHCALDNFSLCAKLSKKYWKSSQKLFMCIGPVRRQDQPRKMFDFTLVGAVACNYLNSKEDETLK